MISLMILYRLDMISCMISYYRLPTLTACAAPPSQRPNLPLVQRSDAGEGYNDQDREIDQDEARDYAHQGPLPDRDTEEDSEILATLLKPLNLMCADEMQPVSV